MQKKIDMGKLILGNLKFSKLIKNAYKNYLEIEKSVENRIMVLDYGKNMVFPNKNLSFKENYKNNFFTFLMLSILDNMGIKKDRLIKYGELIFCLRAVVTCTDNMIDQEKKGVIFLKNIENEVVNNTLLLMTMENILMRILSEMGDNGEAMNFILNKIHSVARSESLRNRKLYSEYPQPEYILKEIHRGIGGELLQLSLWAPAILEENVYVIDEYNEALFYIGMSLQALDDLCDMEEDYGASQVNLGISRIKHDLGVDTKIFSGSFANTILLKKYPDMYNSYVNEAIETALRGFNKLGSLGYPVSEKDSLILLKYLFQLRGIKELWDISKYGNKRLTEKMSIF